MRFFVGTYTRMGGAGVVEAHLLGDAITRASALDALTDPTYVISSGDGARLFTIGGTEAGGGAAVYDIASGPPRLISRAALGGEGPCHMCLSPDERFLYVANYRGGSLSVASVAPDGTLAPVMTIQHEGRSAHPHRQEAAHVHQVGFVPGTRLVWAVDLGMDAVLTYRQNEKTGRLTLDRRLDVPAGHGPRHLVFAPNGRDAYLANELDSSVSHLTWDGGRFALEATYSMLPDGFAGENTAAAIRIAPGRLYASNRGHDSLAAFDLLPGGALRPAGHIKTFGELPRDFWLLEENRALVAHQQSGDVSLIELSEIAPGPIARCEIPAAVCVCPA